MLVAAKRTFEPCPAGVLVGMASLKAPCASSGTLFFPAGGQGGELILSPNEDMCDLGKVPSPFGRVAVGSGASS